MKILIISAGVGGGAGIAALRLHRGLLEKGFDSKMLTDSYAEIDSKIFALREFSNESVLSKIKHKVRKKLIFARYIRNLTDWSNSYGLVNVPLSEFRIHEHPYFKEADIINVHWYGGLLDFPSLLGGLLNKKVVWTLHDMSIFTGGCQYTKKCKRFEGSCRLCPFTQKGQKSIAYFFDIKHSLLSHYNHTFVYLNKWMKEEAEKSSISKSVTPIVIPNGIDNAIFRRIHKEKARAILGLPTNLTIALFIAQDLRNERKGVGVLENALKKINISNFGLIRVGEGGKASYDFPTYNIGPVYEPERLNLLYNAADFLIHPALMDNLPNTILESLLAGTPVLAFKEGGITDIIISEFNGILLEEQTAESLEYGIIEMISKTNTFDSKSIEKDAVRRYGIEVQVENYVNLFQN